MASDELNEEITAIKMAKVLQFVLDRMDEEQRTKLLDLPPFDVHYRHHEYATIHAGDLDIVSLPLGWLLDPNDTSLPDLTGPPSAPDDLSGL